MNVEVVYARADVQALVTLDLEDGATVRQAIERSGLLSRFPEIDLAQNKVGVFSRLCGLERTLMPGDRVEIYRRLSADPQDLRRMRAAHRPPR